MFLSNQDSRLDTISRNIVRGFLLLLPALLLSTAWISEQAVQAQEAADDSGAATTAAPPATIDFSVSLLQDTNGDGVLQLAAFGDSLTRGVGDFISQREEVESGTLLPPESEAGYPLRLENILGVQVTNLGDPGEDLVTRGIYRFSSLILSHHFDVVFFMEGSNDGFAAASSGSVQRAYQMAVNIARMANTTPILIAMPPVCCSHDGLSRFIDPYRAELRHVAAVNGLPVADADHAFRNTCDVGNCDLLNLPEGLHPNTKGYDIIAEAVLAAAFKVDLFAPAGPAALETLLLLPPGSIETVPDPISSAPAARTDSTAPAEDDLTKL